jgi:type IV pilus assembly protein PilA
MKNFKSRNGFTLIELLLVIGIIAILAAIVIVAINPTKQLGDARDAQRRSDVNTILNAIWQYAIDHNGSMPCDMAGTTCVDSTARMFGTATENCDGASACPAAASAAACFVPQGLTGTYIVSVPSDPRSGSGSITNSTTAGMRTRYVVQQVSGNRLRVTACSPEIGTGITVTR